MRPGQAGWPPPAPESAASVAERRATPWWGVDADVPRRRPRTTSAHRAVWKQQASLADHALQQLRPVGVGEHRHPLRSGEGVWLKCTRRRSAAGPTDGGGQQGQVVVLHRARRHPRVRWPDDGIGEGTGCRPRRPPTPGRSDGRSAAVGPGRTGRGGGTRARRCPRRRRPCGTAPGSGEQPTVRNPRLLGAVRRATARSSSLMAEAIQWASVPATSGARPETSPPPPRGATSRPTSSRRNDSGPRFDTSRTGRLPEPRSGPGGSAAALGEVTPDHAPAGSGDGSNGAPNGTCRCVGARAPPIRWSDRSDRVGCYRSPSFATNRYRIGAERPPGRPPTRAGQDGGVHVVAAPDKFRGTATAAEVAEAIGHAVEAAGHTCDRCPMADGGEGTLAVLGGANRRHGHRSPGPTGRGRLAARSAPRRDRDG